jgi:spermidine/putrescine transport system permease protein
VSILGITLLIYFSNIGLFGGRLPIIVAHVIYTIPFAMGLIRLRLSQMDQSLEAAAWNLGARPWEALVYIILPFTAPAMLASLFLTIAVSFDEFAMAWLVGGFTETVPVRILSLLQREMSPRINAIGGVVFTVSIVLLLLAQWVYAARTSENTK